MRRAAMVVVPVFAALALSASGCRPASTRRDPLRARLERLVDVLHRAGRFDGAVVVSDATGVLFERGCGWADAGRQAPFTPDTPTDGASLAKTFTAALVLGLAAEGVLDVEAPVQRWLPELPYPDVTLRHLLSHSSGIPVRDYDFFDADLPSGAVRTTESLLRILAARHPPPAWPPGTAFEYSSFCYDLAALAASRAGKASYFDLLKERFFEPLAMSSAFARPGRFGDFPGIRTRGYRHEGDGLVPNDVFDGEAFHGGSNLYISARDLDRWNGSFLRAPRLSPEALAELLTPATIGSGTSGLTLGSWYRRPDATAFWYSGHLQGFHSEVFRDLRRGWSVVYTSNNTIDPWMQKGLVRAIVAALEGEEPMTPAIPAVEAIAKEDRAEIAGRYEMPDGDALAIETVAGRVFALRAGVRYEAFAIAPEAFYVPGLDLVLGFARAAEGGGWRMFLSSNTDEGWWPRQAGPG